MVDNPGSQSHRYQIQQELETDQWVVFKGFANEEEMRKTFTHIKKNGYEPRVLGEWDSEHPEPERYKPGAFIPIDGPNGKPLIG